MPSMLVDPEYTLFAGIFFHILGLQQYVKGILHTHLVCN